MNKEEDGGFSLVVLALAVVLYIAILCMTFAGVIVTRPTVGDAFLEFTKDYGSLLAGIPVLIAVLVAKQQLDANRRQHVAQIKRSFDVELEDLKLIEQMSRFYLSKSFGDLYFSVIFGNYAFGTIPLKTFILTNSDYERLKNTTTSSVLKELDNLCNSIVKMQNNYNAAIKVPHNKQKSFYDEVVIICAEQLLAQITARRVTIAGFWS